MIFVTINIPYYHTLTAARISSTQSFAVAASEKRSSTRLPLSQISNTCEHHDEQLIVRNIWLVRNTCLEAKLDALSALVDEQHLRKDAMFVVCDVMFAICGAMFVICNAMFVICDVMFAICGVTFVICDAMFVICDVMFVICDVMFAICGAMPVMSLHYEW